MSKNNKVIESKVKRFLFILMFKYEVFWQILCYNFATFVVSLHL